MPTTNRVLEARERFVDTIRSRPDIFHNAPTPKENPDEWILRSFQDLIILSLEKVEPDDKGGQVIEKLKSEEWWLDKPIEQRITDALHYADLLIGNRLMEALLQTLEEKVPNPT